MKGMVCASEGATAIRHSMEQKAILLHHSASNKKKNENQLKKSDFRKLLLQDDDESTKSATKKSWRCTNPAADDVISPALFTLQNQNVKTEHLSSSHDSSIHQVVFLRVSLHCRGCEKKLRKHLSTIQGVTSFDIDFMAKKVTVAGNVTPSGLLSSISKVKNAQLWSPSQFNN